MSEENLEKRLASAESIDRKIADSPVFSSLDSIRRMSAASELDSDRKDPLIFLKILARKDDNCFKKKKITAMTILPGKS